MEIQNITNEINHHHLQARTLAKGAVEHARAAGRLLLRQKSLLPHGRFLKWLASHTSLSPRNAQRYMAVALDKPVPIRVLAGKSDTVSYSKSEVKVSKGIWEDDHWTPEPWYIYLFRDDTGAYWVTPSLNGAFHVCKHYSGEQRKTAGAYWRYTIFSTINDPDFTSQFYIGTRFPIQDAKGIEGVLKSYGLTNLKNSLVFGSLDREGNERPFGEPESDIWYWDSEMPDDGLFKVLQKQGYQNSHGAITFTG
jgi:hypothetical protein